MGFVWEGTQASRTLKRVELVGAALLLIVPALLALCGAAYGGTWRGVLEVSGFSDEPASEAQGIPYASHASTYSSWRLVGRAPDGGSTFLFHTQGHLYFEHSACSPEEETWNESGSGPQPGNPAIAVASAQKKNKTRFSFAVYGALAPYRSTLTGGADPNSDPFNPVCLPPRLAPVDPNFGPTTASFPSFGSIGGPPLTGKKKKGTFSYSYRGSTTTENAGNGPCVPGQTCTREVLRWRLTFRKDGDCDGIENARDKKTTSALCNTPVLP